MWPEWRLFHLAWIIMTLGSWYILGVWMGAGYCPVTDLHWTIKESLGGGRPMCDYIYYCLAKLPSTNWNTAHIEKATLFVTILAGAISLLLNIRDYLL